MKIKKKEHKVSSPIWNHFKISATDPTKAICNYCKKNLSRGNGNSTFPLINHLQSKHYEKYKIYEQELEKAQKNKPKQATLFEICPSFKDLNDKKEVKELTQLLLEHIYIDMVPFNVVNGYGFRKLINFLAPNYKIPCPSHFSQKLLPETYEKTKNLVKNEILDIKYLSGSTDIWTSLTMDSYLSLTVHGVNQKWQKKHFFLGVFPFNKSHTSIKISTKVIGSNETI